MFRFPPTAQLERRLLAACREAIAGGETPLLLAYSLGKAQEAAAILTDAGIPSVLHGAAWKLLPEFAAAGISLPLSRAYETGPPAAGEALITPPSTARTEMVRRSKRRRSSPLAGRAQAAPRSSTRTCSSVSEHGISTIPSTRARSLASVVKFWIRADCARILSPGHLRGAVDRAGRADRGRRMTA